MADVLTSNLYPPIMDTFMPSFTGNQCNVYFELSDFNTIENINTNLVQVSVRYQESNITALNSPNGIILASMQPELDGNNSPTGRYYITIDESDLTSGFDKGKYYKVQIRFSKHDVELPPVINAGSNIPGASWINTHLNEFSEWSSECLIKKITEPELNPKIFTDINNQLRYHSRLLRFIGDLEINENEKEYLSEYTIELIAGGVNGTLIEKSKILYPKNNNKILFNSKKKMELNATYTIKISIITNSGYTKTFSYTFLTPAKTSTLLTPEIRVISDPDQGRNKIEFSLPAGSSLANGTYYVSITRTSSRSDFLDWEEIGLISFYNGEGTTFFDSSIESGVWYEYTGQLVNSTRAYGDEAVSEPVMTFYEDVFLNSQGKQLKLQFDSHITSYKKVVMEAKTETLGSPYPIIRRNSKTNYKQFALTGIISFLSDDGEIFLTEDEIYDGLTSNTERYKEYNEEHRITPYTDYIKEREFRERVINYLTSDKAFLLRTMTEGVILIKLMNVNITPNQSLNNYICTFTADAIEIDESNPENYYKYKVFPWMYSTIQLVR